MMKKALFLSLPSVSVNNTLTPIVECVSSEYNLIHYNTESFCQSSGHMQYRPYPRYYEGYATDKLPERLSYFKFADILLNTSISIIDFLVTEVEKEKPDFILHSHLAIWGKIIAKFFEIPAVSLFSTFVLDTRIMKPYLKDRSASVNFNSIDNALSFIRKSDALYNRLGIQEPSDIWDAYVNSGMLNLSFILESFQPQRFLLDDSYHFLGPPRKKWTPSISKNLIYVSLGTVFNNDITFYKTCIDVFSQMEETVIISAGKAYSEVTGSERNIKVVEFTNQIEVLRDSKIFVTRGGMASVHESLYNLTPMIIVPEIPEQVVTAERIEELGLGINIPAYDFNHITLKKAVNKVLKEFSSFQGRILNLLLISGDEDPGRKACDLIKEKLFN